MRKNTLVKLLNQKKTERQQALNQIPQPILFDMEQKDSWKSLEKALGQLDINEVVDEYDDMLEELYFSRNAPHKFQYQTAKEIPAYQDFLQTLFQDQSLAQTGVWIYYPWNGKLVHFLPKKLHEELRTARNKSIITDQEQEKFRKFRIGIAGLSIGQSVAYTIAINGGCEVMHLADFDVIAATNTNRIRASFDAIGMNKAIYAARLIYEINPFAKLKLFVDGITEENISAFFTGVDAVVDEIDNFAVKLMIREEAKKRKIPILMAADVVNAVSLEIERYDLNLHQKFFNGKLHEREINSFKSSKFKFENMAKVFVKLHGGEKAPQKLLKAIPLIGKQLAGPPQLGTTAFLSGVVISYIVKRIACKEKINSCSLAVDLDTHLLST